MPPIQTIASPCRNRISVAVPREYREYSFQVILVPLAPAKGSALAKPARRSHHVSFVDALLSRPKLEEGEELEPKTGRMQLGLMKDEIKLPDDFDRVFEALDDDVSSMFSGVAH